MQPRHGGKLHHVESEHLPTGERPLRNVERLIPAEPAGHGRSRRGHDRRIKPVHVERQIHPVGKIRRQKALRHPVTGDVRRIVERNAVFAPRLHLVEAQGPDAELRQRQAKVLHGPAHDAGVAPQTALVAVAQVRVGVELNDPERPETLLQRGQRAVRDRMLPAQKHGQPPVLQYTVDSGLDRGKHRFGGTGTIHGGPCADARLGGDGFPVPQFQLVGGLKNGLRPFRRSARIGNGGLQRYGQHMKQTTPRFGIRQFGGEKTVSGFARHVFYPF